jgi:hypothetical protein
MTVLIMADVTILMSFFNILIFRVTVVVRVMQMNNCEELILSYSKME